MVLVERRSRNGLDCQSSALEASKNLLAADQGIAREKPQYLVLMPRTISATQYHEL